MDFKELEERYKDSENQDIRELMDYIYTLRMTVHKAVCILEKIHFSSGSAVGFEVGKDAYGNEDDAKTLEHYD